MVVEKYTHPRTGKRRREVQKLCAEVRDLRESGLDVVLEVLHGHGGEVVELVSHFVRPAQVRG